MWIQRGSKSAEDIFYQPPRFIQLNAQRRIRHVSNIDHVEDLSRSIQGHPIKQENSEVCIIRKPTPQDLTHE